MMRLRSHSHHPAATAAALLTWSAVGFCGVYWASQVLASPASTPEAVQTLPAMQKGEATNPEALAQALGGHPASAQTPAPVTSRWFVKGVVATPDGQGAAVMTDGTQPPRVYRAGAVLADGTRVLRIERDGVVILRADLAQEMKLMVPSPSVSTAGAQTDASAPAAPAAASTAQTSSRPQIERTPPPPGTVPTVATAAGEAAAQMKPLSEGEMQNLRQALEEERAKALTAPGAPGFFVRSGMGPLVPPSAQPAQR